jgi:hypothetical protein
VSDAKIKATYRFSGYCSLCEKTDTESLSVGMHTHGACVCHDDDVVVVDA